VPNGWVVHILGDRNGHRGAVKRQTWYAAVPDPAAACEEVRTAAIMADDEQVKAVSQVTEAQLRAQRVEPGEVRRINTPSR
jgi:hypothetical protein